jgi:hypothetical protein
MKVHENKYIAKSLFFIYFVMFLLIVLMGKKEEKGLSFEGILNIFRFNAILYFIKLMSKINSDFLKKTITEMLTTRKQRKFV